MTQTHSMGDVVCFRKPDGDKMFGTVDAVITDYVTGNNTYMVKGDDGFRRHLSSNAIVDLKKISEDAAAALEKFARQDRARADLLSELLGKLDYFAECEGRLFYTAGGKRRSVQVKSLVDEYMAKRDAV